MDTLTTPIREEAAEKPAGEQLAGTPADRPTLARQEAVLRRHASVEDAVLLSRRNTAGGWETVAYIVASAPVSRERLRTTLEEQQAAPAEHLPTGWVFLAALPLTPEGQVDTETLAGIEVIDETLARQWEEALGALPEVDEVAVLKQEVIAAPRFQHLDDLVPGWKDAGGGTDSALPPSPEASIIGAEQDALGPDSVEDAKKSRPLAVHYGDPIQVAPDAPRTLPDALRRAAEQTPEAGVVYVQQDGSELFHAYPQLLEEAERVLAGLRQLGLQPGDKALLQLEHNQDFVPAFWGCVLGGFIPVPVSIAPAYDQTNGTVLKLYHAWKMLGAPVILAGRALAEPIRMAAGLLEVAPETWRVASIDTLRSAGRDTDWHAASPDEIALILLTSGSTGEPKGVTQPHSSLISQAAGTAQRYGLGTHTVSLNWLPLDHVGGIVMCHVRNVYLGCKQVHAPAAYFMADPLHWLDMIDKHRATFTWAPNFAYSLVNTRAEEIKQRTWDLSSLTFIVNGGEAVVAKTARRFLELLIPHGLPDTCMYPTWGMSETSSATIHGERFRLSNTRDEDAFVEVGFPLPGFAIRIVDEQDQVVEEEAIGNLQVTGATLTAGYYGNPALNEEVMTPDGWFRTGDLGFLRDGGLTLTGRGKDVIIVNGSNYYCHEIEAVVEEIPGIEVSFTAACAVRTAGSDTDELAIFFHTSRTAPEERAALAKEIRSRVVSSVGLNPAFLLSVTKSDIPKTEIGKIQRPKLRKQFEEGVFDALLREMDLQTGNANTLPDWFFTPVWQRKALPPVVDPMAAARTLLFVDPSSDQGLSSRLAEELAEAGGEVWQVVPGPAFARLEEHRFQIDPHMPHHYRQMLETIRQEAGLIEQFVHLWTFGASSETPGSAEALESSQYLGAYSLLFLADALGEQPQKDGKESPARLLVVSSGTQAVASDDPLVCERTPLLGLLCALAQEQPSLLCRHLDLLDSENEGRAVREELRALAETGGRGDREVAYRGGARYVPRLAQPDFEALPQDRMGPLKEGGVYLLSGGLGGIAVELARMLLSRYQARLLLVGRAPLEPGSERERTLQSLRAMARDPEQVRYAAADVSDLEALQSAVAGAVAGWDALLEGVFHLAGAYHDRTLAEETPGSLEEVLKPKVEGALALHQIAASDLARPEALFVHFSTAIGFFGGAMIGAYLMANRFLDSFAHYQRQAGLRAYSLDWSTWDEVGMSRGYAGKDPLRARGFLDIRAEQGMLSLLAALRLSPSQVLVGLDGANLYVRRHQSSEPGQVDRVEQLGAYYTTSIPIPTERLSEQVSDRFGVSSTCDFHSLTEMPHTETSAIDREALAALAQQRRTRHGTARIAPRNDAERELAAIWQEVLSVSSPGIEDSFFEMGGNSLLATQVLARIRNRFGVELPLSSLFEKPTIAGLAERLADTPEGDALPLPPLVPVDRSEELPLSFTQQRLWFIDQFDPGNRVYNVPFAVRIAGALNVEALAKALHTVVARHESLRTVFPAQEGRPVQVIQSVNETEAAHLILDDLRDVPPAEREAELARCVQEEARRPFNMEAGPLLRCRLLRMDAEEYLLMVTMHHIISDGWSVGVFNQELGALYDGYTQEAPVSLPALPVQYVDYAAWQRERLQGDAIEAMTAYWKQQLAGVPQKLELPTDKPRPPVQSFQGAKLFFDLPVGIADGVRALCQREETTLFMALFAAFQTLMLHASGQEGFCVGSPIAGRTQTETEGMIGFLANTLALRADLSGDPTFRELLVRVRETALGAFAHQETPLEKVMEAVRPIRDPGCNPLFQVNFRVVTIQPTPLEMTGLNLTPLHLDHGIARFDLALELWAYDTAFRGYFEYATDLFTEATLRAMQADFARLLEAILAQPDAPLSVLRATLAASGADAPGTEATPVQAKRLRDVRRKAIDLR